MQCRSLRKWRLKNDLRLGEEVLPLQWSRYFCTTATAYQWGKTPFQFPHRILQVLVRSREGPHWWVETSDAVRSVTTSTWMTIMGPKKYICNKMCLQTTSLNTSLRSSQMYFFISIQNFVKVSKIVDLVLKIWKSCSSKEK